MNLRRLRRTEGIRDLVGETHLLVEDLILPLFVKEGEDIKEAIPSMPGVRRLSLDNLIRVVEEAYTCGLKGVLLFGVIDKRGLREEVDPRAWDEEGIVQKAIREIKKKIPQVVVITDVCVCGYTIHGHCGVVREGEVDNRATLDILGKISLSHARAGADFVAPSAMMDGEVLYIREILDREGYDRVGIISYSVKYASSLYYPFREAVDSSPRFGNRKGYQMDYRNWREAIREAERDIQEGADMIMVKPALPYLDVVSRLRERFSVPLVVYQVSGEYNMLRNYVREFFPGDKSKEREVFREALTSMKRAGADLIITYYALEMAKELR